MENETVSVSISVHRDTLPSDFHFLLSFLLFTTLNEFEQYVTVTMQACYIECFVHLMI